MIENLIIRPEEPADIDDGRVKHEIATFGPLAVEPTMEGNDIGGALISKNLKMKSDLKLKCFKSLFILSEKRYDNS